AARGAGGDERRIRARRGRPRAAGRRPAARHPAVGPFRSALHEPPHRPAAARERAILGGGPARLRGPAIGRGRALLRRGRHRSLMRIIAGSRKGHTIHAPKGLDTRPTGDRVREAAFNLIGPVDGASVLDLFAGSGALGLEALSRGAERAVFVESDRDAVRAIERNLDKLRLRGATVLRTDAVRALASEAAAGRRYDLVLVDP